MAKEKSQKIPANLVWRDDPDVSALSANHAWLHQQGGDALLTFGQIVPPTPGQTADTIEIRPVARIALSNAALARLTSLLGEFAGERDDGET